jgi:peptidyl-prolyl cis-trans isomerase SurA
MGKNFRLASGRERNFKQHEVDPGIGNISKMSTSLPVYLCWWILVAIGIFPVGVAAAETVIADRIVAVVNEDVITLYDLNQAFKPYEANIKALGYSPEKEREALFKLRADLLNQVIERKLADQVVKRNKIEVSEKEIDAALDRIKESRALTDEDFRAGLAQQGLTMEEYRNNLKQQLLRNKLVNREVKSKIVITEDEIKRYYDTHNEKYAGETKYHIWNIFIRVPGDASEFAKRLALEKMESVATKLKQGEPFESLAAQKPDSPMAPEGADLGLYRLEELSPPLQKAIKDMKAGDFSPILDTDMGYQIIYVQKIVKTNAKSLADVKSEIQQTLYEEAVEKRFQTWLQNLRQKSNIKIIQ